jgi:hypothetical protein
MVPFPICLFFAIREGIEKLVELLYRGDREVGGI